MSTQPFAPLQGVIFDWAGTLVDFGSFAPVRVLIDAFADFGIAISLDEARVPMGLGKLDHIRTLGAMPAVAERWQQQHGRPFTDADAQSLYEHFLPRQIRDVAQYSQPIPGAVDVLAELRAGGLKIGSCTGYPRTALDTLLPVAAAAGVVADHAVATDDLAAGGRPGPWMALANVIALGLGDVRHCVKVDDTTPGILEGRRAGMWTVGLTLSGNLAGLTEAEWRAADARRLQELRQRASRELLAAGAHLVIDTIADLPGALRQLAERGR